jgi:OmpA-OmpF porin, OOP family
MKTALSAIIWVVLLLVPSHVRAQPFFSIHATSVQRSAEAERIVADFQRKGWVAFSRYETVPERGQWHQVYVGRFASRAEADAAITDLRQRGLLAKNIRYVLVSTDGPSETSSTAKAFGAGPIYTVHLSSFRDIQDAQKEAGSFSARGLNAFIRRETVFGQGQWHRVYVGRFDSQREASALAERLIQQGVLSKHSNFNVIRLTDTEKDVSIPDKNASVNKAVRNVSAFRESIEGSYVASYRDKSVAERQVEGLTLRGWPAFVTEGDIQGVRWYRVYLSPTGERVGGLRGFTVLADLSGTQSPVGDRPCCEHGDLFMSIRALLDSIADNVPDMGLLSALRITGVAQTVDPLPLGLSVFQGRRFKSAVSVLPRGNGETSTAEGVAASDSELSLISGRKALIILSDFKNTGSGSDPSSRVRALNDTYGPDICVYPIYFCPDESGLALAHDMASITACGNFYDGCLLLEDRAYFDTMIRQIFYGDRLERADADGDGVPDDLDQCPDTPLGARVDERGCWVAAFSAYFDFDRSVVKEKYLPHIRQAADVLKANPHMAVTVAGHTDNIGRPEYNMQLGQRRADAVAQLLLNYGVSLNRLALKSYGETKPIATNETAEGRAKNRRVELEGRRPLALK